ncbi:MAG: hypothetical protein WC494_01265 [Candidatus Pacearchaeota archaeon]
MKVKEIKEKENKIKELEEESKTEKETIKETEIVEDDIEQFSYEEDSEPAKEQEEETEVKEENKNLSLEEVILDTPLTQEPLEEKRKEELYTTSSSPGEFYSGSRGTDFYSQSDSLYKTSSEGVYSVGEKENEEGGSFYNKVNQAENERVGEIHGARGSKLEIEGVKGAFGLKKDSRKDSEKYSARSY